MSLYCFRLQEWQDSKTDSDMDSKYEELEGGLRVPSKMWQSLYHYQKVGVQWLWELHQQDVGGILGKFDMILVKRQKHIINLLSLWLCSKISKNTFFTKIYSQE